MTGDSFKFQKRSQFFIGVRNETPWIVAVRVTNPDYRISVAAGADRAFLNEPPKTASRLVVQVLDLRVFDSQQIEPAIPELFVATQRLYAPRVSPSSASGASQSF